MDFPIYFSDLTEEAQKRLLDAVEIKTPEEMNWDIFPFTQYVYEEND